MYKTGSKNHYLQQAKRKPQNSALFADERPDVTDEIDDRETDDAFYRMMDGIFNFTVDVAAAPHNAKCEKYFTRADNGLEQDWGDEMVWCNPPYSDLRPWLQKAWDCYDDATGIVMLVPANRCEQPWWQDLVEPFRDGRGLPRVSTGSLRTHFVAGRIRFRHPVTGMQPSPPFGCVLLIWHPFLSARDAASMVA
jgi:phage N-6-adenine-methyltransferase